MIHEESLSNPLFIDWAIVLNNIVWIGMIFNSNTTIQILKDPDFKMNGKYSIFYLKRDLQISCVADNLYRIDFFSWDINQTVVYGQQKLDYK